MKIQEHTYRPLPNYLTIQKSPIHGLGLFVKSPEFSFSEEGINYETFKIKSGVFIGISHIHSSILQHDELDFEVSFEQNEIIFPEESTFQKDDIFPNGLIRTPLGGFINHSDNPNLNLIYLNHGCWGIVSTKDINPGEELTVDYKYTPCGVVMNKN